MEKKKILLAEDEEFLSRALSDTLSKEYLIKQVFNGDEVLDSLSKDKYDLLLLDIMMPGENGFNILEKIKSDNKEEMKIIVLSNLGQESDMEKAKKLGADDYIVKANNSLQEIIDDISEELNY